MDLLDLPPEIFARVIRHLVIGAGIMAAWEHRKACRTFRRSIEFETFANQPTRAFLQSKEASARSLLRRNQALYLRLRSTVEKSAYTFLPRFVKRISDFVCSNLSEDDYSTRKKYTQVVCNLLIKEQHRDVQHLIETKAPESSYKSQNIVSNYSEDVRSNYIAAAAAVGDLEALRNALQNNPDEVWQQSPVFGYPLAVAAVGRHFHTVAAIVKHFEHTHDRTHMADLQLQFTTAISAAFEARNQDIALLLLRILHAYGSFVASRTWKIWMSSAVSMRSGDLIHQVNVMRRNDATDVLDQFQAACNEGDLEAVRMFIEEGFVPIRCCFSGSNIWSTCETPIETAVRSKKYEVVELVLKLGANPNSDCVSDRVPRPLWTAITHNSKRITKLLLQYGAHPGLIMKAWEGQQQSFRDARANIRDMMGAAVRRRDYYVPPKGPLTNFAGHAPDLVVSDQADGSEVTEEGEEPKAN